MIFKALLPLILLPLFVFNAYSQNLNLRVMAYDIDGLKLGMTLDQAKKEYELKEVNTLKDSDGIISGYEAQKVNGKKKVTMAFTSEQRLYNIHYYNSFPEFIKRSEELLSRVEEKYGAPQSSGNKNQSLIACWGAPCRRTEPRAPYLRAIIEHYTGNVELILYHKGILEIDWKKYKSKSYEAQFERQNRWKKKGALDF